MAKTSGRIHRDPEAVDVVVIGAGMAGLAAAGSLVEQGFSMRVFEAAPIVGGLGRSVVGGDEIEAYAPAFMRTARSGLRPDVDVVGLPLARPAGGAVAGWGWLGKQCRPQAEVPK